MANDRKIEAVTPNLFVKYRDVARTAIEEAVREALAKHKAVGNPVAVSRDGRVVLLAADEIGTGTGAIESMGAKNESDVDAKPPRGGA